MQSRNVVQHTTSMPSSPMVEALAMALAGNARRNAPGRCLLKMQRISCARTKMVVVLMPPPVDPGEAPMNIRIRIVNNPALLSVPRSSVAKPAVRADTLRKNAVSQLRGSVNFNNRAPAASKNAVVVTTTLECRVNLRKRNRHLTTSTMTRKPMPPEMIRKQVLKFSSTLSR